MKDGRVSKRLLALALVLEGATRKVAAESCGMDRQTLRDWAHRHNAEGVEGLPWWQWCEGFAVSGSDGSIVGLGRNRPDLAQDGVVRWRRADLARRIEARYGIKLHERTVATYLAKLGFGKLSVRPEHPNADPEAQATFKKLCQCCSGHPA